MDLVNAVLTFLPAAAVAYSIGSRMLAHHRRVREQLTIHRRPFLPIHLMFRLRVVRAAFEPVRDMPELAEPAVVRPQQNQIEPVEPAFIEPPAAPQLNRLSRTAEIAMLAVLRNDDGTYRHSANAITKFVGGTAADVKKQIAEIRGTKSAPQEKPSERASRPPKGWAQSA